MSDLTPEEYQALLTIVQRAPITHAEVVALQLIMTKLAPADRQGDAFAKGGSPDA